MTQPGEDRRDALAARRLEELVRAHREAVSSYVRRRAPMASVDDIVAETFLVAWRQLARVPADSPLPWLLAVARNVIATQRRAAGRREALYLRLRASAPTDTAEPANVEASAGRVALAMASLGEKDREALALIAWEGLRPSQAAAVMGESPSRFYVRLHRAKRRLRRRLAEQHDKPADRVARPARQESTS